MIPDRVVRSYSPNPDALDFTALTDDARKNINKLAEAIRHKVYGVDVRESIAVAILLTYDTLALENNDAVAELVRARGTEPTLKDRLDKMDDIDAEVNAQLAQTKYAFNNQIRSGDDKLRNQIDNLVVNAGGDSNPEVIQARGKHDVLSGRFEKIEEELNEPKVENPFESKGLKVSISNENDIVFNENKGVIFPPNTYEITESEGRHLTEYIRVEPNDQIAVESIDYRVLLVELDADRNYMATSGWIENGNKARIIAEESGYFLVMVENNLTDISERTNHFRIILETKELVKYSNDYNMNVLSGLDIPFKRGTANGTTGLSNYTLDTRIVSDYIYLKRGDILKTELADDVKQTVVFYDENSNVISSIPWSYDGLTHTQEKGGYVRVILAFRDDRVINDADIGYLRSSVTEIKGKVIDQLENKDEETPLNSGYYFRSHPLPPIPTGSNALSYAEFINQTWETLRNNNEDRFYTIEREVVTQDSGSLYDIYEYTFTPRNYEKTVFLTAGVHGDEYESFYGLYYFMENIVKNWYKIKKIRDLRHNVRFVIIPVLNPYGLENTQRLNYNGVNANDNYDIHFGEEGYHSDGEYGFSEKESLATKLVADKYNGAFDLYFDFHTDPYDTHLGRSHYVLGQLSSLTYEPSTRVTLDFAQQLKDKFEYQANVVDTIVRTNVSTSSFRYIEEVHNVPSAILEGATNRFTPIGSSDSVRSCLEFYTGVIVECINDIK